MHSAEPRGRARLSPRLVNLAVRLAWAGAAFALHTAFVTSVASGPKVTSAVIYALGLAATLGVHRSTRGPVSTAIAFALCFALFVEGAWFALAGEGETLLFRAALGFAMALPLGLLVVRRWAIDAEDGWFADHARGVVRIAVPVALVASCAGLAGWRGGDPGPYERALVAIGYSPFVAASDFMPLPSAGVGRDDEQFAVFLGSTSVPRAIRDEVRAACGRLAGARPGRASACAHELLVSRARASRMRRDWAGALALASALPIGLAGLFGWRGRRRPSVRAPGVGVAW